MAQRPYFKCYPSDFIAGVVGMQDRQIAVYTMLIMLMYARRKKIPCGTADDQQSLARICGMTTRRFNMVIQELTRIPSGNSFKITVDQDGNLSNPRFERMLAGEPEEPEVEQNGERLTQIYREKNPRKIRDNLEIIPPKKTPTSSNNNDLAPVDERSTRARARSRVHSPERRISSPLPEQHATDTAACHMDEPSFNRWICAIRKTLRNGWSRTEALKRWKKIAPAVTVEDMIAAWFDYYNHVKAENAHQKFKQRVRAPESWLRDHLHESYVEALGEKRQAEAIAQAARAQHDKTRDDTIAQWNGHAAPLMKAIGKKFELFVPTTLTEHNDRWEIDFHARDSARSTAEQFHEPDVAKQFDKPVMFTSDHKRKADEIFQASRKASKT